MPTFNAISRLVALTVGVAGFSVGVIAAPLEGWSVDLNRAFLRAKTENKYVLVEFTGTDWCPPCVTMRNNVFSKKEFVAAASKKFILVELDVPKGDQALKQKNAPLAEKYKIVRFPTVILFTPKGKEYERFFASAYPQVDGFLKHLDASLKAATP